MAVETIQSESLREKSEKKKYASELCFLFKRIKIHVIGDIKGVGEGITKRICEEITAEHFLNLKKTVPRNSVNLKCKTYTEAHHNQIA